MGTVIMTTQLITEEQVAEVRAVSVALIRKERYQDQQILEHYAEILRKRHPQQYKRVITGEVHPAEAAAEAGIDQPPLKGVRWIKFNRSVRYDMRDVEAWIDSRRTRFFQEAV
jgi:hypothetical protein